MAKFRRTEAAVWVAGSYVTKSLDGPNTYDAWEESWSLLSVAMVSLGEATPGTMNAYGSGIKTLLTLFPGKWGQIAAADMVVRSERWCRLREYAERTSPLGFSRKMPWDWVISNSAFGREGLNASWWQLNFILPSSLNVSVPVVEGMPRPGASHTERPNPKQNPKQNNSNQSSNKEICQNYNNRQGACAGNGPCPAGRLHSCSQCPKGHRACDHHDGKKGENRYRNKGQNQSRKGKGKGS